MGRSDGSLSVCGSTGAPSGGNVNQQVPGSAGSSVNQQTPGSAGSAGRAGGPDPNRIAAALGSLGAMGIGGGLALR
jgi:hypothetical protein